MEQQHSSHPVVEPDPSTVFFTEEELQRVDQIKQKYPEAQAALMPVLWMAQKKFGWLSTPVMKYVASILDLPFAHVQGVATFYTMYWKKPMGQHHIQVCTNISCLLRGGEGIYQHVSSKLGLRNMERSQDGHFSLE